MTEKIYKPKTCKQCLVAHITKNKFECGVSRGKAKCDITNSSEMYDIWCKCPIDWDIDVPPPKKEIKKSNILNPDTFIPLGMEENNERHK